MSMPAPWIGASVRYPIPPFFGGFCWREYEKEWPNHSGWHRYTSLQIDDLIAAIAVMRFVMSSSSNCLKIERGGQVIPRLFSSHVHVWLFPSKKRCDKLHQMLVAFFRCSEMLDFFGPVSFSSRKTVGLMCTFDPLLSDGLKANVSLTGVLHSFFIQLYLG